MGVRLLCNTIQHLFRGIIPVDICKCTSYWVYTYDRQAVARLLQFAAQHSTAVKLPEGLLAGSTNAIVLQGQTGPY